MPAQKNVINDILEILEYIRERRQTLSNGAETQAYEMALDRLQNKISEVLSALLSTPLSGVLDIIPPIQYIAPSQQMASLQQNLVRAVQE